MAKSQMSGTGRLADVPFPGPGMIILHIVRVCSLISLLTAATACWAIIVHTKMNADFAFFDAASLAFTSFAALFLSVSEIDGIKRVRNYYKEDWPMFGEKHGLTWIGVAMCIIGCNILGKLNLPVNSSDTLGMPLWRLVLSGGILSITFGAFNMTCSLIWRNSKEHVNARHIRRYGRLAEAQGPLTLDKTFYSNTSASPSLRNEKTKSKFMSLFWKKDAEADTEKAQSGIRTMNISGPIQQTDSNQYQHPTVNHNNVEHGYTSDNVSYDTDNPSTSPIVPGMQRPDSAMHPMRRQLSVSSSKYSTAHFSRMRI